MSRILFEAPMARALIRAHGRETACEVLARCGADDVDERIQSLFWEGVGSRMERYVDEGTGEVRVQSVFPLTDIPDDDPDALARAVYWDNEGVVVCGRPLPESVVAELVGRPMTDVVDHPYLAGLTVSETHNHHDGDVASLVFDAEDCMWDIERVRAEA